MVLGHFFCICLVRALQGQKKSKACFEISLSPIPISNLRFTPRNSKKLKTAALNKSNLFSKARMPLLETEMYYISRQRKYWSYREKSKFSSLQSLSEAKNVPPQAIRRKQKYISTTVWVFFSSLAHQQRTSASGASKLKPDMWLRSFINISLHDQPYTYIYLHLPVEAIVQQQVVGHPDPVGFHWMSLAIIVVSNITW